MIYLKQDNVKFIYPYLLDAKRKKNGIVNIISSANDDEILQIRFISETSLGIKFSIGIPNTFSLTMMYQDTSIIVYKYFDAEHYPDKQLLSIDEINLIKEVKPFRTFQFVFNLFTDAIIQALADKEQKVYDNLFEYYSFRTIRFLFLIFIAEIDTIGSWGTHNLKLLHQAIEFDVQGNHFKGKVKIIYNAGADLFQVTFLLNSMIVGERTGLYFDELIDFIDKKVEYIPEYNR
ncbi:MAG: hypothetical protein LBU84_17475 [Prevotella sp.]|jgi:hypothetical protein|nr:hypothetical protein [Prevotella sp.]